MMTPLMMLRFRLGVSSVSRPWKQQTAASFISFFGVALRHSSSFIKAHNCIRLFFFFLSLFICLHYDTTMSTYSSNINFVPAFGVDNEFDIFVCERRKEKALRLKTEDT